MPEGEKAERQGSTLRDAMKQSHRLVNVAIEPKYPLPSPSSNNPPNTEISQSPPSLLPPASLTKREAAEARLHHQLETEADPSPELGAKGKRQHEPEHLTGQDLHEPIPKRARTQSPEEPRGETKRQAEKDDENCPPIQYWAENGQWPKEFFRERDPNMNPFSRKRPRLPSYTQSVKDGDNPKAYTLKYEEVLADAGIFMYPQTTASNDCRRLCDDLLNCEYDTPDYSLFHGELFEKVLKQVYAQNKSMVCRDITPSIVPSAELLYLRGSDNLERLTEELNAVWTKCSTLAGPRPKPDFCVGLKSSAFSKEEILRLKSYTASNKTTLVTENLYFPFLICEVKCREQGLDRADRQNAHSGSIAVNALVQLYRAVPLIDGPHHEERASSRVEELNQKILAFSISHNDTWVRIYGHYAIIDGDKETFYRHPIHSFDIAVLNGKERWTTYNLTRKIYDEFAPLHLHRIRSAIAQLPDPSSEPITSEISVDPEEAGSQEFVGGMPSSQESAIFKRPALPATVALQQQINRLDMLLKQNKEQIDQYKEQTDQYKE